MLAWAYQRSVTIAHVSQAMQEILDRGLCVAYSANGRTYYELHDWGDHQFIQHPTESVLPGPHHESSCVLMSVHEDSRGLMSVPRASEQGVLLSPTTGHTNSNQDLQTKNPKYLKASNVPEAAKSAVEKSLRVGKEASDLLGYWFSAYKGLFGQAPGVEGARDMLAAKALLGGRNLEQAKAIVDFHLAHPSPFYAERKLFGLHHIRKDCNQIIARMANLGPAITGPDYLPKSTKRTMAAVDTFRRGGKPSGRK